MKRYVQAQVASSSPTQIRKNVIYYLTLKSAYPQVYQGLTELSMTMDACVFVSVTTAQVERSHNRSLSNPISFLLIMANNLCMGRIWKTGQEKSDTSFGKPSQLLVFSGLWAFLSWRLKLYHCFWYSLMDFFPQNCLIVFLKSTCVLGWRDIPWQ